MRSALSPWKSEWSFSEQCSGLPVPLLQVTDGLESNMVALSKFFGLAETPTGLALLLQTKRHRVNKSVVKEVRGDGYA